MKVSINVKTQEQSQFINILLNDVEYTIALNLYIYCMCNLCREATCASLLCRHSYVLWFHVSKVGFLPLTHEVKVQRAVAEGAGSRGRAVDQEPCLLPNLHEFFC